MSFWCVCFVVAGVLRLFDFGRRLLSNDALEEINDLAGRGQDPGGLGQEACNGVDG